MVFKEALHVLCLTFNFSDNSL